MKTLLALAFSILAIATAASANDVYIAQSVAGGNTGADCADAKAGSYFNTSGNWVSSGPTGIQIGPGTTVHVCGTWTGTGGAAGLLVFHGSGSSGNPVTLHFETGAGFTAPYWGGAQDGNGAIEGQGFSYVVVDGGTNGYITAT